MTMDQEQVNETVRKSLTGFDPAFPNMVTVRVGDVSQGRVIYPGLSKRELLAGMAMQGLLQRPSLIGRIVERSVQYADELLAELKRTEKMDTNRVAPDQDGST